MWAVVTIKSKIRGFHIELGEIESLLEEIVPEVVVLAEPLTSEADEKSLIAYVVQSPEEFDAENLKRAFKKTLPPHMIPSIFVRMDALPLTPMEKLTEKLCRSQIVKKKYIPLLAPKQSKYSPISGKKFCTLNKSVSTIISLS